MKVKITYLETQNEINEIDLELVTKLKGEFTIGRSPDCDLPLESSDISRYHAKFFVQGGNYYFCDTESRNGSIINNHLAEKNQPYILKHGDFIQIGDYVLKLEKIKPEPLPVTVVKFIDPALFSGTVSKNINVADITNRASKVVSEATGEVITPNQEEVAEYKVVYTAPSEEKEVTTPPESQIAEASNFVQPQDIITQPLEIVNSDEKVDLIPPILQEFTSVQPRFFISEDLELEPELTVTNVDDTSEELELEASSPTPQLDDTPELVDPKSETVAKAEKVQAVDNAEANTESEPSQMSIKKNIVLIAHESKKSELAELVVQHQEFFSQSLTLSWLSVSEVLNKQAGLIVSEEIPSPTSGGYQKINSLLNSGDILAVIFLRDFLTSQTGQANEEALLRTCNINEVLVATNLKTAEAIVHYLQHTHNS